LDFITAPSQRANTRLGHHHLLEVSHRRKQMIYMLDIDKTGRPSP
jgi:hypothetical protein